jgi:hypothetical protein
MISSWFNDHPDYIPDVKAGGFGPLFRWMLVPSVIIACVGLLWSERRLLPVLFLFAISIIVPMAWWPRFIIGAAMASLICYAQVSEKLPRRWVGSIVGLLFAFVSWQGLWTAMKGAARFSPMPKFLEAAWKASPVERSSLQIDVNLWPTEWNLQKEGEFQPGDAITYDESGYFLSELWCHDYRNPVFFVSSRQPPRDFLTKVHELRARWVGLHRDSETAAAIQAIGGQFLFTAPATGLSLYRLGSRR